MICKQCGKEHWTKECHKCRDSNLYYNKKAINSIKKNKNSSMFKSTLIILLIVAIGVIGIGTYQFIEITKEKENLHKIINNLKSENSSIKRSRDTKQRLVNSLTQQNRSLVRQVRTNRNYNSSNIKAKNYTKPRARKTTKKTYSKPNTETRYYDSSRHQTKNTTTKNKNTKTYQNFSQYIHLISDSKIQKRNDNKLTSSAPIYGRFYSKDDPMYNYERNQISNIICGLKNNRYGAVDECSMKMSDNFDLVYLGTMDSRNIMNYNNRTHMIECTYSREHGIMHNCKIKIKS